MKFFYKRFYCINTSQCSNAYKDYIYSKSYYKKNEGICRKCGKPLIEGELKWNFPPIFSVIALLIIIGISAPYIYNKINPKPLVGIGFKSPLSTVTEQETAITVTVERQNNLNEKVFVYYHTESGTAKAGEDFSAEEGQIIFQPGEKKQEIVIPIISDLEFLESREVFNIQLVNVEGLPKHKVIIQNASREESVLKEADAIVRAISVVAMDIAEYYVKKESISIVIESESMSLSSTQSEIDRFIKVYKDHDSNLTRSRERYIQLLKDLEKIERPAVIRSIDNWTESLERQGFDQQRKATVVMKEHLVFFLNTRSLEMKTWVEKLANVIPKPKTDSPDEIEFMIYHRPYHPSNLLYLDSKA